MAAAAEELLIRPFKDVLAVGTVAAANATHALQDGPGSAGRADRMARAAHAVIREGERALEKMQLVWNDQVGEYGDRFIELMVQQASIEKRRLQLEELLWDFDDFTHPDDFDQSRGATKFRKDGHWASIKLTSEYEYGGGMAGGRGKLEKPPKYDADMLELMEGARIVGVIFPEKWGGKFCLGRHDGEFGAFPAKAIELRPPQESEIPAGGESGMSVTTRWKWQPPVAAGVPWLAFGKGEVISNVQSLLMMV
ncbi:hypothetical protein N0V88_007303 [Collariella sp. IMI 366227]|nr:hypothetical protein N0V88_007303 [Collariella sp. IMI 366227]